jgi:hypothetical protein
VKLKIYVVDLELGVRLKKWLLRVGVTVLLLGAAAVALAAGPLHVWSTGDTLQANDLNNNFSNLQNQITYRTIARAHGNGPNDQTVNGAIATRLLQYNKTQAATGLRVTWTDNTRCYGAEVACEWEIKIDGSSCTMPGPLVYDMYNDAGNTTPTVNIHRAQAVVGTCFGISAGPHTIQVYVKTPASNPTGGSGPTTAGSPWTGWNVAYWSIEVEEVY